MKKLPLILWAIALTATASTQVSSPDGKIVASVETRDGQILYTVSAEGREVLDSSPIGVKVDTMTYGSSEELGTPRTTRFRERFAWLGKKAEVDLRGKRMVVPVTHAGNHSWQLELTCFNDAVAWRAIIPGEGDRTVKGETSAWVLPKGAVAWCDPVTSNYEGIHERWVVDAIPQGHFTNGIGMPITFELPGGGYAALTEADIMGYSGMTIEATGSTTLVSSFRDDPSGWTMHGEIRTPWRVLMIAKGLDDLVNCDAVPTLCPAPDSSLFPKGARTDYLKPGRCLWQWWAYDRPGTLWEKQHWFVDQASALGCQYYLVDEGWQHPDQKWATEGRTEWGRMKELCEYAATKNVEIWIWQGWNYNAKRVWPGIETRKKREDFFRSCAEAGVKGTKIDFMDSESHEMLEFYHDCLSLAAQQKIMVNFHGANKPAGEARTWPNEMTREGIRGLEYNKWSTLPPHYYATAPFTRYLVGHGDFTPTTFQPAFLKGTTVAQQLACAVIMTSPILCWADKPDVYLESPAVDIIRSMPPVWDETHVLGGSRIGDLAAFARRSGKVWYVGIINGAGERQYELNFAFLPSGKYVADFFGDTPGQAEKFQVDRDAKILPNDRRTIKLNAGGGFVAKIRRE